MNIAKVFVSQCKVGGSDKIDEVETLKLQLLKEPPQLTSSVLIAKQPLKYPAMSGPIHRQWNWRKKKPPTSKTCYINLSLVEVNQAI